LAELELLIRGGKVFEPRTRKLLEACVGVEGGRIALVGEEPRGMSYRTVLEARGLVVSPGFVDSHVHVGGEPDDVRAIQRALLLQGVTTAVTGHCGESTRLGEMASEWDRPMLKLGTLVGHTTLRRLAGLSSPYEVPTEEQMRRMSRLLEEELEEGAFGLSFGLEYVPSATNEEILALAEVLDPEVHVISIHIRHDGPRCLEALREAIEISEISGIRVCVSHIGSMVSFGMAEKALSIFDEALEAGVDLAMDSYPYSAFCTTIGSAVFDEGFEERWGKGVESLQVASGPLAGSFLDERTFQHLREREPETLVIAHVMDEREMRRCLSHPRCAIASDGVIRGGRGHPRAAGAFPRGIRWLLEGGSSLAEAIARATVLPASNLRLREPRLEVGAQADLVVFDPLSFRDRASFEAPLLEPEGLKAVLVDGKVVVLDGKLLDDRAGRLLRR